MPSAQLALSGTPELVLGQVAASARPGTWTDSDMLALPNLEALAWEAGLMMEAICGARALQQQQQQHASDDAAQQPVLALPA